SRFITEAVEHELIRRRREGLLRSLASPHPEAAELAETGLADRGANMPLDDEGLVDEAAPRRTGPNRRPRAAWHAPALGSQRSGGQRRSALPAYRGRSGHRHAGRGSALSGAFARQERPDEGVIHDPVRPPLGGA